MVAQDSKPAGCAKRLVGARTRPYTDCMSDEPIAELDARGLLCPLPVLKTRKRLAALKGGEVIRVATDDPAAIVDMPHFCAESGHELMARSAAEDGAALWTIRKVG